MRVRAKGREGEIGLDHLEAGKRSRERDGKVDWELGKRGIDRVYK